jgi:hypothetical protein
MKRLTLLHLFLFLCCCTINVSADSYFYSTAPYPDADKTGQSDSNMCAYAAMADIFAYSGWNAGMNSDQIFNEMKSHFPDTASNFYWLADYWFYGQDDGGLKSAPGGGGYYSNYLLSDYTTRSTFWDGQSLIGNIDSYLHSGDGVALALDLPYVTGHAVACYGDETDSDGNLIGLWVVDNNDRKDTLIYLPVKYTAVDGYNGQNVWQVTDGAFGGWCLNTAYALEQFPGTSQNPVPEPSTFILAGLGILLVFKSRKLQAK